jgi:hypothetical protein
VSLSLIINRLHFSEHFSFDHRNLLKKKERIVYPCSEFPILEGSGARAHRKEEKNGKNLPLKDDGDGPGSGLGHKVGKNLEK